jgi:hypothetical protein
VFGNLWKNHTLPQYGEKKDNEAYSNIYLELCKSLTSGKITLATKRKKITTIGGNEIEIL